MKLSIDEFQHRCLRKVRYATKAEARQSVARARRNGAKSTRRHPLVVYRCDKHWHIGHRSHQTRTGDPQ